MTRQLFLNNAGSTLNGSLSDSVTLIEVATGEGANFPALSEGEYFHATLIVVTAGVETAWEIVKVTARATDIFTVVRGAESTTPIAWADASRIELRVTAITIQDISDDLAAITVERIAAETAATAAESSEVAALASEVAAAISADEVDDIYLGAKSSDPTLDNDGDPLVAGMWYFNDVLARSKIYDGDDWLDPMGAGLLGASNETITGDWTFTGTTEFTGEVTGQLGIAGPGKSSLTGTTTVTDLSFAVTGSGTAFDTELAVGDLVLLAPSEYRFIDTIADATNMVIGRVPTDTVVDTSPEKMLSIASIKDDAGNRILDAYEVGVKVPALAIGDSTALLTGNPGNPTAFWSFDIPSWTALDVSVHKTDGNVADFGISSLVNLRCIYEPAALVGGATYFSGQLIVEKLIGSVTADAYNYGSRVLSDFSMDSITGSWQTGSEVFSSIGMAGDTTPHIDFHVGLYVQARTYPTATTDAQVGVDISTGAMGGSPADVITDNTGLNIWLTGAIAGRVENNYAIRIADQTIVSGTESYAFRYDGAAEVNAFVVDSAGNVGVGTYVPTARLKLVDDALTTSSLIHAVSDSASTGTRNLVLIHNDNVLATDATVLNLQQDANAVALNIDTSATTKNGLRITASFLTNSSALNVFSGSTSATGRNLVQFLNNHTSAVGTTTLAVMQNAANRALFVDQNANGIAIEIDSEATTLDVLRMNNTVITEGNILSIQAADALTTGSAIQLSSNSASTGVRDLLRVNNVNSLAVNTRTAKFIQNAAGVDVEIRQAVDGISLLIDTEATSADCIDIMVDTITTGNVINTDNADALTTGSFLNLVSNSADVNARKLVIIDNQNALADAAIPLWVNNVGDARVAQFVGGGGIEAEFFHGDGSNLTGIGGGGYDNGVTDGVGLDGTSNALTTGKGISITSSSVTSGTLLHVESTSASLGSAVMAKFINNHADADNAKVVLIQQDGNDVALFIDMNGTGSAIRIDTLSSTFPAITIPSPRNTTSHVIAISAANWLTSGGLLSLVSDGTDTTARNLLEVINDNSLASGAIGVYVQQDSVATMMHLVGNANGVGLRLDTAATGNSTILVNSNATTTGACIGILANNALTSGQILFGRSFSAATNTRTLFVMQNNNALATGATVLEITQNSTKRAQLIWQKAVGIGLQLDNTADGISLYIDTDATTANAIVVAVSAQTTGDIFNATVADSLETGGLINLKSNSAHTGTRTLALVHNDHVDAVNALPLKIINDAAADVAQFVGSGGQLNIKLDGDCENTNNAYGAISDRKFKTMIVDAKSQTDDIRAIGRIGVNYKLKSGSRKLLGVIAQDLELICPGLVTHTPDNSDEGEYLGVNYSGMYMKAVLALAEQINRADTAEDRVNKMEVRLEKLEKMLAKLS